MKQTFTHYAHVDLSSLLLEFSTSLNGLDAKTAHTHLAKYGPNTFDLSRKRPAVIEWLASFFSPLPILLLILCAVSWMVGEAKGALVQGLGLMMMVLGLYLSLPHWEHSHAATITISFAALVLGNLLLIIVSRSSKESLFKILKKPNPSQTWIIGITAVTFLLLIWIEPLRERFQFSALSIEQIFLIITAGIASLIWHELAKWLLVQKFFLQPTIAKN